MTRGINFSKTLFIVFVRAAVCLSPVFNSTRKMGLGQVLKKIDAFPKIDLSMIEVNKTFSGAIRECFID